MQCNGSVEKKPIHAHNFHLIRMIELLTNLSKNAQIMRRMCRMLCASVHNGIYILLLSWEQLQLTHDLAYSHPTLLHVPKQIQSQFDANCNP